MLVYYNLHIVVVQSYRKVLTLPGSLVNVLQIAKSPRFLSIEANPRLKGKYLRYLDGRRIQTLNESIFGEL